MTAGYAESPGVFVATRLRVAPGLALKALHCTNTSEVTVIPHLSRSALNRDHDSRTKTGAIEAALEDPATRIVLLDGDKALVSGGRVVRVRVADAPADATFNWLGRTAGTDDVPAGSVVLSAAVDQGAVENADPNASWQGLRSIGAELDDEDAGIMTQAVALHRWQQVSGFSPRDGSPVEFAESGWVGVDQSGAQHFPRVDPAVIALITDPDDERVLLGRNALWDDNRYSLFAGFVDLGESLEAAVIREVREEAGVEVVEPRYVASQPWPFPRSLMLGFEAVAPDPDAAHPDGVEIVDVRWLTRDEVSAGVVGLPGGTSIASFLLQRWIERA